MTVWLHEKKAWLILSAVGLLGIGAAFYWIMRTPRAEQHYKAALEALEKRDFQQAHRQLQQFLELRPDDMDARLLAARTARRSGDFAEARRHLQIYREGKKDWVRSVRLEHQLIEAQSGNLAAADELLASQPAQVDAEDTQLILEAVIVGRLVFLQQQHDLGADFDEPKRAEQLAMTKRAIGLWLQKRTSIADRVQGLAWRGKVEAIGSRHADAVKDFRAALELDPDHLEARLFLAWALAEKAPNEAAEHLEKIRKNHPNHHQARFFLAKVRRGLGQFDESRRLLEDLLSEDSSDSGFLIECGQVALDMEKPAEAEPLLRKALSIAPKNLEVHVALGRALVLAGKPDEAKWFHDRAREIEEDRKRQRTEAPR